MRKRLYRYYLEKDKEMVFLPLEELTKLNITIDESRLTDYTGICDSKGVHIYEGDIIDAYGKKWKIIFSEGCYVAWGPGRCKALRTMYCQVIGNMFENPRLMYQR